MISIFIQIILFLIIFFVCSTYFVFWLYTRKDTINKEQFIASHIRLYLYVKCICLEIVYILLHILFFPFSRAKLKIKLKSGLNQYPILLIPGFIENQTDWWFHRTMLHRYGFSQIYTLNLYPTFGSIEEHAKLVQEKIQLIKLETNSSKVILIGHSRGGLVASYCNEFLTKDIALIISIATPFGGSKLAKYAYGKYTHQMQPNSDFLQKLTKATETSITTYKSIATTMDSLVFPWDACIPGLNKKELLDTYILDDIGHTWVMRSSKISSQLNIWLKEQI